MLIIFSGLPGTGKSTLARDLACSLGAVYLRIDSIEQAIVNSVLNVTSAENAGYLAAFAVAQDNLGMGRTVVADSVNPLELTRTEWRKIATRAGCESKDIEVVCSDPAEHQRRIEDRVSDVPDLMLPTWQDVLDREYHPWKQDRIVIDTSGRSAQECVEDLKGQLGIN